MQHVLDNCAKTHSVKGQIDTQQCESMSTHLYWGAGGSLIHFAVRMGGRTWSGLIYLAVNLTFKCYAWTVLFYWLLITCVRKSISMGIDYTLSSLSSKHKGVRGGTPHTASFGRDKKLFLYRFQAFWSRDYLFFRKVRCKEMRNSEFTNCNSNHERKIKLNWTHPTRSWTGIQRNPH